MKQKILTSLTLILLFMLSSCATRTVVTQNHNKPKTLIYVKTAPPKAKVIVVKKCSPNSIWIKGHWKWNGNRYIWLNGHCTKKRKGHLWIPGHWKKTPRGWKWIPGHWK